MICQKTVLNRLSEEGYAVLKDCISNVQLKKLLKEFEQMINPPLPGCCRSLDLDVGTGVSIVFGETKHDSLHCTQEFFQQDWMQDVSIAFWENEIKINQDIYVMHELPGTVHVAQDLHFDVLKTLKFFLYLNDVSETNGAFSCVPKSHKESEKIRQIYGDEISYKNRHLFSYISY